MDVIVDRRANSRRQMSLRQHAFNNFGGETASFVATFENCPGRASMKPQSHRLRVERRDTLSNECLGNVPNLRRLAHLHAGNGFQTTRLITYALSRHCLTRKLRVTFTESSPLPKNYTMPPRKNVHWQSKFIVTIHDELIASGLFPAKVDQIYCRTLDHVCDGHHISTLPTAEQGASRRPYSQCAWRIRPQDLPNHRLGAARQPELLIN
jgi:hypothetical protein